MKIAVMGAGAVGAYFGGRLAACGVPVTFVARGDHLHALVVRGLSVHSPLGDFTLCPVDATDDMSRLSSTDAVLLTVRSQNTLDAARRLQPVIAPSTPVVSLQDGVANEDILLDVLGLERVLCGVAHIDARVSQPGVVEHKSPYARIVFGELGGGRSQRAEQLLDLFTGAAIDATLSENVLVAKWSNWLFSCAFNGVTSLVRKPIGAVLADPDTALLYQQVMHEIAELARARGVPLPDNVVEERLTWSRMQLKAAMESPMQRDLLKGRPLELDALNGHASRLGREVGVSTPLNDFIYAALKLHKQGG